MSRPINRQVSQSATASRIISKVAFKLSDVMCMQVCIQRDHALKRLHKMHESAFGQEIRSWSPLRDVIAFWSIQTKAD